MRCSIIFMKTCRLGMIILAASACAQAGWGQAPTATDEAAIRQAAKAYIEALLRGDTAAAAAAWTNNGKFIDATGQTYRARDYLQKHIGPARKGDDSVDLADTHHSTIRFLTQNVAVEEGGFGGDGDAESEAATSSYSAVWVKQGDQWLLESVHESYVPTVNPLTELDWLIGEWAATHNDLQVHCSSNWSDNEKFIVQTFSIEKSGKEVQGGSQRIGWDPAAQVIRSWVFDSHGGFSEGSWRKEGDAWIVKSVGVLPDGGRSAGLHFWIPEGNDRIAVKHCHVQVNGAPIDDVMLEFARVPHGK